MNQETGFALNRNTRGYRGYGRGISWVILFTLAGNAVGQETKEPSPAVDTAVVNAMLETIRAKHSLPALAGAVVLEGRVAVIGAVGVRKIGDPVSVTPDDLWHIGSCTKAMTATLAAILIDQGKLRWDSTIKEVLQGRVKDLHADYAGVTVEQLLQHRGGLPANPPGPLWMTLWSHSGTPRQQRQALLDGVLNTPAAFKPGSHYEYSNTGYAVVGAMMETIMDKPYEDLIREMLFEPLEMKQVGFGPPGSTETVDQPRGHRIQGGQMVAVEPGFGADNPSCVAPAGRVHCTLRDWGKFLMLHAGIQPHGAPLLKPETLERLHTPPRDDEYAAGWIIVDREWARGRALTHAGSNTLWFTECWVAPERKLALLTATNGGDMNVAPAALDEAATALLKAFETSSAN